VFSTQKFILFYRAEVYISYFDENKNVEAYLEWETKVDQIFEKYQLDEFSRFFLVTLSFQEYARSWWTQMETMLELVENQKS